LVSRFTAIFRQRGSKLISNPDSETQHLRPNLTVAVCVLQFQGNRMQEFRLGAARFRAVETWRVDGAEAQPRNNSQRKFQRKILAFKCSGVQLPKRGEKHYRLGDM
jgi:hypothetical protein